MHRGASNLLMRALFGRKADLEACWASGYSNSQDYNDGIPHLEKPRNQTP